MGFEKSAGKKESEESQEPCGKKCRHTYPDQTAAAPIDVSIGWTGGRKSCRSRCLRGPDCRRAYIFRRVDFRGINRGAGRGLRRIWIRTRVRLIVLRLIAARNRHECPPAIKSYLIARSRQQLWHRLPP